MRVLNIAALLMLATAGSVATAQTDNDIMQMSMAELETNRQAVVTAAMQLTDSESQKFWPVYKAYRGEVEVLKQRTLDLIKAYAANYGSLTNEQASELIKDYLKLDADRTKVRNKYVKTLQKQISPVIAMRFLQVENKLNAIVSFGIAEQIPLAQ